MSSLPLSIPLASLAGETDRHDAREAAPGLLSAAERLGLMLAPPLGGRKERKLEDWIASTIDHQSLSPSPATLWNRIINGLPGARDVKVRVGTDVRALPPIWSRFQVAYKRGLTIVRLVDKNLVKVARVEELRSQLLELITADNHRLVVDFSEVERFSSWVAATIVEAARLAAKRPGGALKICGIADRDQRVFLIAGGARIPFAVDQGAAIESPWPSPPEPPALPVEILSALFSSAETAPSAADRTGRAAGPGRVVLLVQMGGGKARAVTVAKSRYLIGRQQGCDLRLSSTMISKQHAALIQRDGGVFVQDLASTNGTMVRGTPLRNGETSVNHGDRIQVGPVVCTLRIEPFGEEVDDFTRPDEEVIDASEDRAAAQGPTLTFSTAGLIPAAESSIQHELIQDVLVITPRLARLDQEPEIDAFRAALHGLITQSLPRRVVINLENVDQLAARTIGVILAHYLRLDDLGGSLRVCQARARIMTILHQVRLTMLVECYPTLDQAVLDAWPREPNRPRLDD